MTRRALPLRSPLQVAALVAAGAISFAFAAGIFPQRGGADQLVSEVVAPVERVRIDTSMPAVVAKSVLAPDRLTSEAIQNPFAPLGVDAASSDAAKVATKPVADKKPKGNPLEMGPPRPPPPPTAPPLPFTAVGAISGSQVTDGKLVAFIRQQDQLLLVRAGDAIGQSYRVESITSQQIEFMYLPLKQRQVLALAP